MTKISSCSSRFDKTRAASVALVLALACGDTWARSLAQAAAEKPGSELHLPEVGDPRSKLSAKSPRLEGFTTIDSLVFSFHGALYAVPHCEEQLKKIQAWKIGKPFLRKDGANWKAWEPWKTQELQAVRECKKAPCKVKLDAREAGLLHDVEPAARFEAYQGLVLKRSEAYQKRGTRSAYEFPGPIVDPWQWFSERGVSVPVPGPGPVSVSEAKEPRQLLARKLIFAPEKFLPIRQLIDQRTFREGKRVTHLIRDAYTDHYFDGWGEWIEAECIEPKTLRLMQAMLLEFDQFKKSDLISSLARPKLKNALRERSQILMRDLRKSWGVPNLESPGKKASAKER